MGPPSKWFSRRWKAKTESSGPSYVRWNTLLCVWGAALASWSIWRPTRLDVVETPSGLRFLVSREPGSVWGFTTLVLGAQFIDDPETPAFHGWIVQRAGLEVAKRAQGATSALCVGVGGGAVLESARRMGYEALGVDASKRVLNAARTAFGVAEPLLHADGLDYMQKAPRWDVVVVDVFDGLGSTWRFLDRVDVLHQAARFLILNIVVLDEDDEAAAAFAVARLGTRFGRVRAFRDHAGLGPLAASNVVVFATDGPLPIEDIIRPTGAPQSTPAGVRDRFVRWELGDDDEVATGSDSARGGAYDRHCLQRLRMLTERHVADVADWTRLVFSLCYAYVIWMRLTDPWKRRAAAVGPRWLAHACRLGAALVGRVVLRLRWDMVYEDRQPLAEAVAKGGGVLVLVSPHGPYPVGSLLFGIPHLYCDPSHEFRVAAASPLFFLPLFREYALLFGLRDCRRSTLEALLEAECVVALNPGGIYEMVHADSRGPETLFAQANLGCFKLAVRTGAPVFLVYVFGENQTYTTHPTALAARRWMMRTLRIGLPWIQGRFGLSLGPLPLLPRPNSRITHVAAKDPVLPAPRNNSDDDDLDRLALDLFRRYAAALTAFFDAHQATYLPAHVADRRLRVVWLGEK